MDLLTVLKITDFKVQLCVIRLCSHRGCWPSGAKPVLKKFVKVIIHLLRNDDIFGHHAKRAKAVGKAVKQMYEILRMELIGAFQWQQK